jgi:hypothetical protein
VKNIVPKLEAALLHIPINPINQVMAGASPGLVRKRKKKSLTTRTFSVSSLSFSINDTLVIRLAVVRKKFYFLSEMIGLLFIQSNLN